jgi:hypothetical protein
MDDEGRKPCPPEALQCISSRRVVLRDTHPFQGGGGGERKESQGSNVFNEPGQIFSALPPPHGGRKEAVVLIVVKR